MRLVKEKEITGESLIESGKTVDAYGEPLSVGEKYLAKYYSNKTFTVLTKKQWELRDSYETAQEIYEREGLVNWADIAVYNHQFNNPLDCVESVMKCIQNFNTVEDYEKSQYLYEEIQKLKQKI